MRIAIPSDKPGGMDAQRSEHFGHCDLFTILDIDDNNEVTDVTILNNNDHEAGGCMVPVVLIAEAKADAIVVGGIGARPMNGFVEKGITVYFSPLAASKTVKDIVESYKNNSLVKMHSDQVCKGSGDCHH